jgi:hypothetical protein
MCTVCRCCAMSRSDQLQIRFSCIVLSNFPRFHGLPGCRDVDGYCSGRLLQIG